MISEKVIEIVSQVLKVDASEIDESSKQSDFRQWDSLSQLMIVTKIEDEFNIEIEDSVIMGLGSIRSLSEHITKKIG